MTAAAILAGSAVAPTSPRAVHRSSGHDRHDDGGNAPFADVLAAEGDEAPDTSRAARSADDASADSAAASEEAARSDTTAASSADASAQLPAWLLALRTPAPPSADAAAAVNDGSVIGSLAGTSADPVKGSGLLQLPSGLSPGELRGLKGGIGDTPPTQVPPLPPSDSVSVPAIDSAEALALSTDLQPGAEPSLDVAQTAALDAAIARLDPGTASPSPTAALIAADRSSPVTTAAASDTAAASALNASLANQTDAFGEPLSLQGHDAALRLGERLRWLTESGVQEARLQLHPRELGSVDIRIRIEGQGASVWFGADHPGARAALEATLPQLRERLASEGLQLAHADVGSQTAQRDGQSPQRDRAPTPDAAPASDLRSTLTAVSDGHSQASIRAPGFRSARGLVDRYA